MSELLDELHWTGLSMMRESPATYRYFRDNKRPVTALMRFGHLVDARLFDTGGYIVWGADRRGKPWDRFKEEHPDEYADGRIVTLDEWSRAEEAAAAIRANDEAMRCINDGVPQKEIRWQVAGRECCGRPDVAGAGVTELKVTDSNPARFFWHARRQGWHGQLTWYGHGLAANNGGAYPDRYSIVAVPPKGPYLPELVTVYDLSERTIAEGTALWRSLFERLRVCEESNSFPGYSQSHVLWDVPADEEPLTLVMDGQEIEVE